jgi:sugar lactone lactonase YvrE
LLWADGFLYVTEPTRKSERDDGRIWRCNVSTKECSILLTCDWYSNGIGVSRGEDWIYVADSRHRRMVRIPLEYPDPNAVETLFVFDHGIPDGFAFDAQGNRVVACPRFDPEGGDVQVYQHGKLTQVIRPGTSQLYTNVAISRSGRLYVCDASLGVVYSTQWPCAGLPLHPFRGMQNNSSTPKVPESL